MAVWTRWDRDSPRLDWQPRRDVGRWQAEDRLGQASWHPSPRSTAWVDESSTQQWQQYTDREDGNDYRGNPVTSEATG